MKELKNLSYFENLLDEPNNHLVKKSIEEGKVPIGYNCYHVPEPLLSVGNFFPVRLRAPKISDTPLANHYMTSVLCSYSRSILEYSLDGRYDFLGGLVFSACCSHILRAGQHYKMLGILAEKEKFFNHIMDVPRKVTDTTLELMSREFKKISKLFTSNYDVDISEDELRKAIKEYNEFNKILNEIADMRKEENPKITGEEFHKIMVATKVAPKNLLLEHLKVLKDELDNREPFESNKPRLMVVGSISDDPRFSKLIEDQGSVIVADRYCFGSLPGIEEIDESGDPYDSLASHYLNTANCPRMMEKTNERLEYIVEKAKEYNVDGIVVETMKFCDLWGYEVVTLIDALREAGIQVVKVEKDYAFTGSGQLRTRIQAFIESVETKRITSILKERDYA